MAKKEKNGFTKPELVKLKYNGRAILIDKDNSKYREFIDDGAEEIK